MAKVPPYKLICKYVENVNIILEYRGASGPPPKKKNVSNPGLLHYRLAVVLGWG